MVFFVSFGNQWIGGKWPVSVLYIFPRNLEDIVGFLAVLGVGIVVGKGVILVDDIAEAVGLSFVDGESGLLILGFQDKHLKVLLVLGIGIFLDGVPGGDDAAFIIVAEVGSEIIVKLGVLKFFQGQFILQLENSVLSQGNFVGAGKIIQEALKFLDGLDCLRLVELSLGRIEIIGISGIETGGIRSLRIV